MEDANAVMRLAERLLTVSQPLGTPERAQLVPEALPELPIELPLPPDSSVIASVDRNSTSRRRSVEVLLSYRGLGSNILDFYRHELKSRGWRAVASSPNLTGVTGGFPEVLADQAHFCGQPDGPHLAVHLITGVELAKVTVRFNDPIHCGPPLRMVQRHFPPIEMLLAVDASVLRPIGSPGGSSSHGRESWRAYVVSKLRPAELLHDASVHLQESGWEELNSESTDTNLVSVWRNPHADWEAILTVSGFGEDRYLIESFAFDSDVVAG